MILDNVESVFDSQGTNAQEVYQGMEELYRFKAICGWITSRIATVPRIISVPRSLDADDRYSSMKLVGWSTPTPCLARTNRMQGVGPKAQVFTITCHLDLKIVTPAVILRILR